MSNMKDIKKKSDKDLTEFVQEKREEVRSFRFGVAGAGTRDVRKVREAKKNIARALTEQNARTRQTNDAK